jgi:arylsulfotransferase ASST
MNAIATHPMLLSGGDIAFNFAGAMIRMGPCDGRPRWILNESLHHSIEMGPDGDLWTLSIATDAFADNSWLGKWIRDDAVAQVSPEGRLINRWSFVRTMMDNGLHALLLGMQGEQLNDDPLHLNHVAVAPGDGPYWRRGDLLVSARHRSTLFLFRPSTGEIIWHQTGPWLVQHSVAFLDDRRISVFSNNAVLGVPEPQAFLTAEDGGRVMIFDFRTRTVTEPFRDVLAAAKVRTLTGGLAQLLPDGGLFVEETAKGRHLRFTPSQLLWSRINYFDAARIGAVEWSRYLTPAQAAPALDKPPC